MCPVLLALANALALCLAVWDCEQVRKSYEMADFSLAQATFIQGSMLHPADQSSPSLNQEMNSQRCIGP